MNWCRGFTKETHPGVAKISATMKARKIDNFKQWRLGMMEAGEIKSAYPPFPKSAMLAEYIGVTLGDGHIEQFPRCERITIAGDLHKMGYIWHYFQLTKKLFDKKPIVAKAKNSNGVRLSLYEKHISDRLGIPVGSRKNLDYKLPAWIDENPDYLVGFLKDLFEAEAYLSVHLPTCTYNFAFVNLNPYLLKIVENSLRKLEFHPEVRHNAIRLRKKAEVERFRTLISFREY